MQGPSSVVSGEATDFVLLRAVTLETLALVLDRARANCVRRGGCPPDPPSYKKRLISFRFCSVYGGYITGGSIANGFFSTDFLWLKVSNVPRPW